MLLQVIKISRCFGTKSDTEEKRRKISDEIFGRRKFTSGFKMVGFSRKFPGIQQPVRATQFSHFDLTRPAFPSLAL